MSSKHLFYYLGDDEAYFRALQGEFKKHLGETIEFKRFYESSEKKIQSLFLKIINDKPSCAFIDFSKQTQEYLHLARLISRSQLNWPMYMVGLVDYLSPPEILRESVATGVNFSFIKSAETFDVAFSVAKYVAPGAISEHGFANATLKEDCEVGIFCKIGYIHPEGLHIETDFNISKGERLVLDHYWQNKRIVPSKNVFVRDVSSSNMFYHFKYNAELDFLFVDDIPQFKDMPDDQLRHKQNEREDLVIFHKKQLKKWLIDNASASLGKRAKVLVVDSKFHFYENQPRTDKHSYTIRCISSFSDIQKELDRFRPQVIAFEVESGENAKNNFEVISKLVSTLTSLFPNLKPYIILFNTKETSQDLQSALQYSSILGYEDELDPELVIKLSDMLQKKLSTTSHDTASEANRVYIKKNNIASVAEIIKSVTLVKLSETDMILQCDSPLPPGTNLHFTKPVNMFVSVEPVGKPSGKIPEYHGLIHAIGESDKQELRKYVNSIFFREHDAKVSASVEEFKKLNEIKLQEKIKKAEAEAAAAAAAAQEAKERKEEENSKKPDQSES